MTLTRLPPTGPPGIYYQAAPPAAELDAVRMDVCAFAGVAPRGPAWVPLVDEKWPISNPSIGPERPRVRSVAVPVDSWDDYVALFGGHEGPGRLPLAVASFFENGGRRAYIIRIVSDDPADTPFVSEDPDEDPEPGVASGLLPGLETATGEARLRARNQGSWGNGLSVLARFQVEPVSTKRISETVFEPLPGTVVPVGSTLRVVFTNDCPERPEGSPPVHSVEWRTVTHFERRPDPDGPGSRPVATVDITLEPEPEPGTKLCPERIDIVTASIEIRDGDTAVDRTERFDGLGLSPLHPSWLATTLFTSSRLVYPDPGWLHLDLRPAGPALRSATSDRFSGGEDRYRSIAPGAFFDDWVSGDEGPASGVHAIADRRDIALLTAPDLYSPASLRPSAKTSEPASLAGPDFGDCVDPPGTVDAAEAPHDLAGLALDPASQLDEIVDLHARLVEFAEFVQHFVVLLEVPPGLGLRSAIRWRSGLDSGYAAAYHSWLYTTVTDGLGDRQRVLFGPVGAAAGIIARRERLFGVAHGPANEFASGVYDVDPIVSPGEHTTLFNAGINVFLGERDGIRLTSARTLSSDPAYRQLSVRRLVTLLRRTLEEHMQWAVFEPNDESLRADLRNQIRSFLRHFYLAGAFRGATEEEAFFVRCDETNNPPQVGDAGRLIAEIGVAPAEPIEFIVLRIQRDGDDMVRVEERRG